MKKTMVILAAVIFSMGLYSCDADSSAEDDALYDINVTAGDPCDNCSNPSDERDG